MTAEQTIKLHLKKEFMQEKPDVELTDETDLIEQEIIDSLGIFVLISFLEEEFGVVIEPDEVTLENFQTLRAVGDMVRAKQATAQPK